MACTAKKILMMFDLDLPTLHSHHGSPAALTARSADSTGAAVCIGRLAREDADPLHGAADIVALGSRCFPPRHGHVHFGMFGLYQSLLARYPVLISLFPTSSNIRCSLCRW